METRKTNKQTKHHDNYKNNTCPLVFKIFYFQGIRDSQEATNIVQRGPMYTLLGSPMVIFYIAIYNYQNQEIDIACSLFKTMAKKSGM